MLISLDGLSFPRPRTDKNSLKNAKMCKWLNLGPGHRNWTVEILQVSLPDRVLLMY